MEVGTVVDHGEDSPSGVILEYAEILEVAQLFCVGKCAFDAVVETHGPFGADAVYQGFSHERVLQLACA